MPQKRKKIPIFFRGKGGVQCLILHCQRRSTSLLSAAFSLPATILEQTPPTHRRRETLLSNILSGQTHPDYEGFCIGFPIIFLRADLLQRLRQTSTPYILLPSMLVECRIFVSQHEYALGCAAENRRILYAARSALEDCTGK